MTIEGVLKRGDVFLVSFDPTVGAEIRHARPAVVIQNDIANQYSRVTIVAAITSQFDPQRLYPTEVQVRAGEANLRKDSVVLLNQVRSIDLQRLQHRIGRLAPETMKRIDLAIATSLGLRRSRG